MRFRTLVQRLSRRTDDRDPISGRNVANAQMAAFREWERFSGQRFAELMAIRHPTLVVNGVHDEMIPVSNSYRLSENMANAVLLILQRDLSQPPKLSRNWNTLVCAVYDEWRDRDEAP